jgi:phosphoglycerate dehydrogenase-like enzyme
MMNILIDMRIDERALEMLEAIPGVAVRRVELPEESSRLLPSELIHDCEALFCTFPPENLHEMTRLKFIQISSSGYTQLINKGLPEKNIRAANARGVFDVPIAEWNIAMMVNLARDMRGMMHNQDAECWERSASHQQEIHGSTVGIWGYGGIGRETARLAKALGMRVQVLTRNGVGRLRNVYCVLGTGDPEGILPDKVFCTKDKADFLRDLDFLVLAMPQTDSTTGIVGEAELRHLPERAFVLNPARGPLIDERALVEALRHHRIAGAALDTHYYYPMPADHPLWQMPNVIMTPHISGSSLSPRFLERVWDIFVQNITRLTREQPLLNELPAKDLTSR